MSSYVPYSPSVNYMTAEVVVEMGKMAPPASPVQYHSFRNWAQASQQSYEMAQKQENAHYLRQLSKKNPVPPTSAPQDGTEEPPQDFYRVPLAHNRDALHALRRTRKMRHRHNLKLLTASFRLAHEPTTRARAKLEKQAKPVATQPKSTAKTVEIAQQELAEKKSAAMTVEELKAIAAMKAAKVKAAAGERLKLANSKAKEQTAAEKKDQRHYEARRRIERKDAEQKRLAKKAAEDRAEERKAAAYAAGKRYRLF